MRNKLSRIVPVALLALLPACQRPANDDKPAPPAPAPAQHRSEGNLTAEEVKDYLHGKTLQLSAEAANGNGKEKAGIVTIKKEGITALKVGNGASVNNGPWSHEVTFLYGTEEGSYAVIAEVEHRLVEDKRAFFGFRVTRIVKQ